MNEVELNEMLGSELFDGEMVRSGEAVEIVRKALEAK